MSDTHKAEVIRVKEILPHPNADRLELIPVWGFTVVVGKGEWAVGDLGVYIMPDSIVPNEPEFRFLWGGLSCPRDKDRRIRVKRLRGVVSQGLLVKLPASAVGLAEEGMNLAGFMGITHYEPPDRCGTLADANSKNPNQRAQPVKCPHYDIQPYLKFYTMFNKGEDVVITEKIHGANARYVYTPPKHPWLASLPVIGRLFAGKFHVGSRNVWRRHDGYNVWSKIATKYPEIEAFCRANPRRVLWGEVYGDVQDMKYGAKNGELFFAAFDIYNVESKRFLDYESMRYYCQLYNIPIVPVLYRGPYSHELVCELAEGPTTVPTSVREPTPHIREGVVVKTTVERDVILSQRAQLKLVGNGYYERNQ